MEVLNEFTWLPWKFGNVPSNYWSDIQNHRKYLDWVAKELNIKSFPDWYKVSLKVTMVAMVTRDQKFD